MQFNFFKRSDEKGGSESARSASTAKKILLCEDDPFYAEAIRVLLSRNGYAVEVALDGVQALAVLGGQTFDLILCAVQLPVHDGFAILKSVRLDARLKRTPFIFLTAVADSATMDRATEEGATDYFIKASAGLSHLLELIKKYV